MNHSTPGLPVHHQLLEFTQTHAHRVGEAVQPSLAKSIPNKANSSFPPPCPLQGLLGVQQPDPTFGYEMI